ncbi:S9 family peptidase [Viridibacillus arvi]|uniref:S9 family peptidase n=1 Tax=Viridibacillus arvi TaxID=263475 RepID=UPI00187B1642|nr:S9 family peptidase [Viridibacillus sp. JNUCC-6]QOV11533.1 S9 family peptidase [Viridibacillus sp. JNUCC-6]
MIQFGKPDITNFLQNLTVSDFAVNPDEKQLVLCTNFNGHFNLWGMDVEKKFPYPLTFNNQISNFISYSKTGEFLLAGFDKDGDENSQIYAIAPEGGSQVPIRYKEGERHFYAHLTEDGKHLYYSTTDGNAKYLNSLVYDIESGKEKILIEGSVAPTFIDTVSPEEKSFVYIKSFGNTYSLAYVQTDVENVLLTPSTDEQHTVSGFVYTSEDEIYFLTNYDDDLSYLAKFDIQSKQFTKMLQIEKEDFTNIYYSKKEHSLYIVGSYGVEDRLYRYAIADGTNEKIEIPVDIIEKMVIMPSGQLYLLGKTATKPNNIFVSKETGCSWLELTHYRVPGVRDADLVEPEVLSYPSFDGLEIEALLFKAKEETTNGYVILWPHGGPQSIERKSFRPMFQFLVNQGYSIFAPNFRGSSNYGLKFMKMVEGDWGHGPRLDNITGVDWLIEKGYADRDKMLLLGGSYGGYMALLLHGRHADYFKAVVDIFGPSNLFSFIESVPEFWGPFMKQWIGDPEKDKDRLIADSPITYLDGMTKPMLVIQGANDPRVVQKESDQIVAALKEKGLEVEYTVLEDEGHGFTKKANEIFVYKKILEFFNTEIKK